MDMDGMGMGGGADGGILTTQGVDFSNETQAMDFLAALLDDTVLQVQGNQYARYFYYALTVLIALFTISNVYNKIIEKSR